MISKKIYSKKVLLLKYSFAAILLIAGILLNIFNIGNNELFSYSTVGNYLIFCSVLMFFVSSLFFIKRKDKIIDERMEKIGYKSSRITFSMMFLIAFVIMILDGIFNFTWEYSMFMSYFICGILLIYIISYKVIEKYN